MVDKFSSKVNVFISALIGGTISKLTGGKFGNGAAGAAYASFLRQDWSQFNSSRSKNHSEAPPQEDATIWNCGEGSCGYAHIVSLEGLSASDLEYYREYLISIRPGIVDDDGLERASFTDAIDLITARLAYLRSLPFFDEDSITEGVMLRNMRSDSAALTDSLFIGTASILAPVPTVSYFVINYMVGNDYSRQSFLLSVTLSQAVLSPAANYLSHGSQSGRLIWETNFWWLGFGVGFTPVMGN